MRTIHILGSFPREPTAFGNLEEMVPARPHVAQATRNEAPVHHRPRRSLTWQPWQGLETALGFDSSIYNRWKHQEWKNPYP